MGVKKKGTSIDMDDESTDDESIISDSDEKVNVSDTRRRLEDLLEDIRLGKEFDFDYVF